MTDNKHNFQTLTPIKDVDLKIYEDALNFVFENDDIRNVAVAGPYSAGKSSIIETYKEKHKDKKFIHISLAHFESVEQGKPIEVAPMEEKKKRTLYKINSEAIIEGKILNQLIHQIEPEQIPLTQFKTKKPTPNSVVNKTTALFSAFLLSASYNLFYKRWFDFVNSISNNDIKYVMKFTTGHAPLLISGLICATILIIGVYRLLKTQYNKSILRKISFQGNEIEIFEKNDESYFDKYLNEVLYLFRNSGAKVIVFEDMDRYNINQIFGKLREINKLINDDKEKPIRFFYLLKDDIFVSKDRTKFFDYIVPVVPVIDGSNSYDKFIEHFKKGGIYELFDESFLQGLSLYIDDMRILKNIYNEFIVYYNRIQSTELSTNKLLAIITYKNIFPRDFNDLQLGKGFVHTVLENKPNIIKKQIENINSNILILENKIKQTENEILDDIAELDTIFLKLDKSIYATNGGTDAQFKTRAEFIREMRKNPQSARHATIGSGFINFDMQPKFDELLNNQEYVKRKEVIERKNDNSLDKFRRELAGLKSQKLILKNSNLKDIISRDNLDEVFSVSFKNEIGEENNFVVIKASPYFGLIKYLIRYGHIDKTYADYMTYFYGNSISAGDKIFLRSVTDQIHKEYTYSLKNPQLVLSRMHVTDFKQIEILNFDLLVHILKTKNDNKEFLKQFIQQLKETKNYSFISEFLDSRRETNLFIESLNHLYPEVCKGILLESQLGDNEKKQYVIDTLYYSPDSEIKALNVGDCMTNYISTTPGFLNIDNPNIDKLIHGFTLIDVLFKSIEYKDYNKDLFTAVYNCNLYELNFDQISLILEVVYGLAENNDLTNKNYTLVLSKPKEPLSLYINENINEYISVILDNCNSYIIDDEIVALSVLNNTDVEPNNIAKYISYMQTTIEHLQNINDIELWSPLLQIGRVRCTEKNVLDYYFNSGKGIDSILVEFINTQSNNIKFVYDSIDSTYGKDTSYKFLRGIVSCNELLDTKYEMIIASFNRSFTSFDIVNINASKILILIKLSTIQMNAASLAFMRDNYPEQLIPYILKPANIEKYTNEVISTETFVLSEMLSVLEKDIPDKFKIKLLQYTTEKLSISNKKYSKAVKIHILTNNLDTSDIPYLLRSFLSESNEVKSIIKAISLANMAIILNEKLLIPFELLYELFTAKEISKDVEKELLVLCLPNLSKEQAKECLQVLNMDDFLSLFDRKRPKFEVIDINRKLLSIFRDRRWITRFEIDKDDSKYYRANGRRSLIKALSDKL
jgi:hypothetical protein